MTDTKVCRHCGFADLVGSHECVGLKLAAKDAEIEALKLQLSQVDDVLVVNWVGPRKDGDYRKALADLITTNVREALDPSLGGPVKELREENEALKRDKARLESLLNTPEVEEFDKAVPLEAAHQIERWTAAHDAGKNPEDWFWLVGYLAGKALSSMKAGNLEKAKHHCISTAAALRNWHAHIRSSSEMRPGIADPMATIAELKQDLLETRDLLETHRLRIEAHMNTIAEQAKLIEQARKVFGIIPRELMQVVGPPYQMTFTADGFRAFCDAARALEVKEETK